MPQKDNIRKLSDFILQNIETVNSTGLYKGKAGLSLSLFQASRHLQDDELEDIGFRLLQESLITKNDDISFNNGLAGIGYVLLYLIENKYLEANFKEIFEEQYEILLKSLACIEKEPWRLVYSTPVIYFLSKVRRFNNEDNRVRIIIKKIFEGSELFLAVQFQDFDNVHYINKKIGVLNIYKTYLKLINYTGYASFSHSLLGDYVDLYKKGEILSSLEIGFYLKEITSLFNLKGYEYVVEENINNGIKNINLDTLSLKEKIDLSLIINHIGDKNTSDYSLLPEINNILSKKVIQSLLLTVEGKALPQCYGEGLARLLIYCINNQTELL